MAEVGALGGLGRVKINVDHVVERADGHADGLAELGVVEGAVGLQMGIEDDGAQIADGRLVVARVEGNLGAEIRRVDDAAVILRGTDIAGVLEGDPRVTGLEEHREHFLPELEGLDFLTLDLALLGERLVFDIAFFEGAAVEVVKILHFIGAKERPRAAGLHALHEEIGNPIRRVHVVRAAAVIAGVLTQLEEFKDVVVPRLQVGAAGTLALAALVDGDELVVVELQERNDALGFAVGAGNVRAGATDCRPRTAEATGPFGEEGVFGDAAIHDALEGIVDVVEIAGRELRVQRAGVKQRRRAGTEAAALVEFVEAGDAGFAVAFFVEHQAHRYAHPEELRGLDALRILLRFVDDQITIVHCLNAEEVELEVGRRIEDGGEFREIVVEETGIQALDGDAVLKVFLEGTLVGGLEGTNAVAGDVPAEDLFVDIGELDAAGELGEVSVFLDERLRIENDGGVEILLGNLIVNRPAEFGFDLVVGQAKVEADAGKLNAFAEVGAVPERVFTTGALDENHGLLTGGGRGGHGDERHLGIGARLARRGALGAEEDIGLGDLEVAGLHEFFLHHVLNLLDVDKGLLRRMDALGNGASEGHGGRGVALEGEERFADGDLYLLLTPWHHMIVAADDTEGRRRGRVTVDGNLAGPIEKEALRNEVSVVVDEGFLDELIEGVQREADGRLGASEHREIAGDFAANPGEPSAVGVREDVLLTAGEMDVGQGFAERVGDFGEDEALFAVRAQENDVRNLDYLRSKDVAPRVVRLLFNGSVDGALEGEIVREGRITHGR